MEKEEWKVGKNGGCIVSNTKPDRIRYSDHDFESEKEYYGGYLIAESIPDNNKAKVIAAAPDLLEACEAIKQKLEAKGYSEDSLLCGDELKLVEQAIKKATE